MPARWSSTADPEDGSSEATDATLDAGSSWVQYFQSIITVLLAVAGALLFQVRFFELTHSERTKEVDPFSPARHDRGDHRDAIRLP